MTKLLSTYARSTGLQISRPNIKETFYPLPFERYVTIQTGSTQAAKCYDLWPEVLRLIQPILSANRIAVLHLGAKEDSSLHGVHDLRGKTSILQSNHLMRRTMLHIGGDSWLAHCAGWHYRPLVALYGPTDPGPHGPYWSDLSKTSLIVSHRGGGRPTYGPEPSKTINLIDPYHVANEALRLLGINHVFPQQSRFWGQLFPHTILDLIPDSVPHPAFMPQTVINVRMDYLHNEDVLAAVLGSGRRINLIVQRQIQNTALLQTHRAQILSINQELGARDANGERLPDLPIQYVAALKNLFPQHAFFTKETDVEVLSALRLRFLDVCLIEQTRDSSQADYITSALAYTHREDTPQNRLDLASEGSYDRGDGAGLWVRSNKAILCNGAAYPSLAHLHAKRPIQVLGEAVKVIDEPSFWRDLAHFTLYYQPSTHVSDSSSSASQSTDPLQT